MRIRHFSHGSGSGWGKNTDPDPTLNRNEENILKFDIINHYFMLEFVDFGLYIFKNENIL